MLAGLVRKREEFGNAFAEADVGGVVQERFQSQFATAVDFPFRVFLAVSVAGQATDEEADGRVIGIAIFSDQQRTEGRKRFLRHVIIRSGDHAFDRPVVDLFVLAIDELGHDEIDRNVVFRIQFVYFDIRPSVRGFAEPSGEHRLKRLRMGRGERAVLGRHANDFKITAVATAINHLVVVNRFVNEDTHRQRDTALDDRPKAVLAIEEKSMFRQGDSLMREPPVSFIDLPNVLGNGFRVFRAVEIVVHEPCSGKLRCDVDNEGVGTGTGVIGKEIQHHDKSLSLG